MADRSMGVMITLRRSASESPFKRLLLALCAAPTQGGLLLCSGYVWEELPGGRRYSVSQDGLLAAVKRGLAGGGSVKLVAGKLGDDANWPNWETKYRNFVNSFRSARLPVQAYVASKRNWHAKVAVRFNGSGEPVAAIVGSSNLTGPAYRENYGNWNYESDVLLWKGGSGLDTYFTQAAQGISDSFGKMLLDLADGVEQPDESRWMRTLVDDVLNRDGGLDPFHVEG